LLERRGCQDCVRAGWCTDTGSSVGDWQPMMCSPQIGSTQVLHFTSCGC